MPISIDFSGKLVLLTGGGRGIGLGIAKALAEGGADLAITYTSKDANDVAKELSSKYGVRCEAFKCDVGKSEDVDRTVQEVQEAFGRKIEIGVANAGEVATQKEQLRSLDYRPWLIFAPMTLR